MPKVKFCDYAVVGRSSWYCEFYGIPHGGDFCFSCKYDTRISKNPSDTQLSLFDE